MKEYKGVLRYNPSNDRIGIWSNDLGVWLHTGYHCGNVFEIKENGKWTYRRIEMYQGVWFLVDYGSDILGLEARICIK